MSKVTNIACDGCGKTLYGKDKAAFVKHANVQINGQIVVQKVDPDSGYNYPIYITKTKEDRLNFCDLVCLQDFIEYKEKRYEDYKKEGLRERASVEAIDRSAKGLD